MFNLATQKARSSSIVLFAALAAALLALAMLVTPSMQASAAELGTAGLQNGSANLKGDSDMSYILAEWVSGDVKWDASTNTVTLTNAKIDLDKQRSTHVYYAIEADGKKVSPTPTVTLKLVGNNQIYGGGSELQYAICTANANLKIEGPGTLTVNTPTAGAAIYAGGTLTMPSGTVNITGGDDGIYSVKGLELSGAAVSVKGVSGTGLSTSGSLMLKGGSVSISNAGANGIVCSKNAAISGAKTKVTMKAVKKCGIVSNGFSLKSGSITVNGCKQGIHSTGAIKVSGGKLSVAKASDMGVYARNAKLQISKGSVSVSCTKSNSYALFGDKGTSSKPACLKKIKGALGAGATFKLGGNTYTVGKSSTATLKSYGSSKKKASVGALTYGGWKYSVTAIGAKAFKTKKGKAVKALTFGPGVLNIGASALYGTSKLTTLTVKSTSVSKWKLNKKAFTKCGKSGGKGLTVKCAYSTDAKNMKKLFVKAGMSSKATFK